MQEVATIMNLEMADTNTLGWFTHHTTAAKNILNKMTNAKLNALRKESEEMAGKGLPEDLQ